MAATSGEESRRARVSVSYAARIAAMYSVLGIAWIYGSDALMTRLAPDLDNLLLVSLFKGLAFIVVTAIGVFVLLRRGTAREQREFDARLRSDARFEAQYQAIPVPTLTWRIAGEALVLTDRNAAALEVMSAAAPADAAADRIFDDAPQTLELLRACARDRRTGEGIERFRLPEEDSARWRQVHAAFVPPNLVLQHITDIHDQREAEQERRRVQAELRRTAGMLDTLFEQAPIGFAFLDTELRFVRVNRRLAELTGVSAERQLGRQPGELVTSFGGEILDSLRAVLETGRVFSREFTAELPIRPGEESTLWIGGFRVLTEAGETVGTGIVVRDITDRKRAEETLEATIALLRGTLDSATDGILVAGLDGHIVVSNRKFRDLFRLSPERLSGGATLQSLHEAIAPLLADPTAFEDAGRNLHARPGEEGFDIVELADGRVLERHSVPHRVGGRVAGRLWSFSDVTEQRRAEAALRASEGRFRLMIEGSEQVFYYIHDLEGRFVYVSPSVRAVLGYAPDDLVGQSYLWPMPAEASAAEVREHTERALATGTPVAPYTVVNRHRDGHLITLEVTESPLLDGGDVVGMQGFARDVTERRRLEEELRQAQKMEAVGRLAGGVAHDFNNVLTVISGSTHVALELTGDNAQLNRLLGEIRSAAERAATLTRQLLTFSRKQVVEPRAVDLNAIILGTGRMLRRIIGEDIALAVERQPDARPTWADPGQVEQVLMNLVVNARDAMPAGGVLRIRTFGVEVAEPPPPAGPGAYTVLEVADSGVGISADVLPRIFEPFFTTKGMGTGLGLATVYGIVRQVGGWVSVESTPGEGTTFRAHFPVYAGQSPDQAVESAPRREAAPARGSERILVVEDEPAVRRLVRVVLERYGYQVLEARDGRDGLRVVLEQPAPLDLILSDVVMPGMSGPELLQQCRTLCPGTRLALMSGYAGDRLDREDGGAPDRIPVLEKPFEPAQLARVIRALLDGPAPPLPEPDASSTPDASPEV